MSRPNPFAKAIAYRSVIDGVEYEVLECGHRVRVRPGVAGTTPLATRACPDCRKAAAKGKRRA